MIPSKILDSNLNELNSKSGFFIGACGYESRSSALATLISNSVQTKISIAFEEHDKILARAKNEDLFRKLGFEIPRSRGGSPTLVRQKLNDCLDAARRQNRALAFDISSMTRTWHGAIVKALMETNWDSEIETYFAYVPSQFQPPPRNVSPNEVVGPIPGFASLSLPDLPIALLLSLGYEKDKALGFMEILDPGRTVLMIAKDGAENPYYETVMRNNREILSRIPSNWLFEYPLLEPSATFGMLESICGGLEWSYRVVLASLGPKLFSVLCLLLAAKNRSISVWRMSSGVHAEPRDALADSKNIVVFRVIWTPETRSE